MSDQQPEERPRDWMEVWYETGEIIRQPPPPLSPEAKQQVYAAWDELIRQQEEGGDA